MELFLILTLAISSSIAVASLCVAFDHEAEKLKNNHSIYKIVSRILFFPVAEKLVEIVDSFEFMFEYCLEHLNSFELIFERYLEILSKIKLGVYIIFLVLSLILVLIISPYLIMVIFSFIIWFILTL
jgi:hypothetical protein